MIFERSTPIACTADALFAYHARPGALARLTPPFDQPRNTREAAALVDGARAHLELATPIGWQKWVALHSEVRPGRGFVDTQEAGPFKSWRHEHIFTPSDDGLSCTLTDRITVELPAGSLGRIFGSGIVESRLARAFTWRHATTRLDFELLSSLAPDARPLAVGITGASGLVGRELSSLLRVAGHDVVALARSATAANAWDPATGHVRVDRALDAVVHLAGEPIAEGRLGGAHRERVRASRVDATRALVAGLARLPQPPRVFVAASAVGFYGSRGDTVLDETAGRGDGFLAELCADWEEAARSAETHGMRVVTPRIGVVLSPAGGALSQMLPPFRAGLGAVLGDGSQWMPFLAIDDIGAIFLRALVDERVTGAVNATGPEPVTNRAFTKLLGHVLGRPAIARVPKFAARALFGDVADEALFVSQRALPVRLAAWGHRFRHATTEAALRHVLGAG